MTQTQAIVNAVTAELARHRIDIDGDREMTQIRVLVKLEPGSRKPKEISVLRESKRELEL